MKNITVGDVYRKYVVEYPRGKQQGMADFADLISARIGAIKAFLDPPEEPVEETLSKLQMIDLCCSNEIQIYKKSLIQDLPTTKSIWKVHAKDLEYHDVPTRSLPICLVLGPSGSGKTCFALQYLRTALVPPGKKVVTLYLYPARTGIQFRKNETLAAVELMNWISNAITRTYQITRESQTSTSKKLDMHVCLVLDEAGSSYTKAWFESKEMLQTLCDQASRTLASSVTVIVVGTGLTGRELSPSKDAIIFRMKPWQRSDLTRVLERTKCHHCG